MPSVTTEFLNAFKTPNYVPSTTQPFSWIRLINTYVLLKLHQSSKYQAEKGELGNTQFFPGVLHYPNEL